MGKIYLIRNTFNNKVYVGQTKLTLEERFKEHQKVANAYLLVLTSEYRPQIAFKFKNLYPTFLSGIDFDSSNTDTDAVIATATFSYTHYEIEVFTTDP